MTNFELGTALLAMPKAQGNAPARVFPPGECPATSAVMVTELRYFPAINGLPEGHVILTGKTPTQPEAT